MAKLTASDLPWKLVDSTTVVALVDPAGDTICTFAGERKKRLANARLVLDAIEARATIHAVLG